MNTDRIEGIGHQVKGILKETLGNLIGDAKLAADGAAERVAGQVQNTGGEPLIGIDGDRIAGVGHQLKGALRKSLGEITGDPELTAAGMAEREAGKAQNATGSARDEAREAAKP